MRLAAVLAFVFLTPLPAQEPAWLTNFEDAKALAKKEGKPILAAFVGSDWCGYSIRLKDEVFRTPQFARLAAKVVLLEVDFPKQKRPPAGLEEQNRQLAKQYGIEGHAKTVLLDASGKQLGTVVDYTRGGAAGWIRAVEERLAAGSAAAKDGPAAGGGVWLSDYQAALAKAKQEKKLVLAEFTGSDWCPPCKQLKGAVLGKPEFLAWAADHVVLLELDFPKHKKLDEKLRQQNEQLAKQFGVDGYPAILFVDANGKDVGRMTGYGGETVAQWLAAAEKEAGLTPKNKPKGR